LLGNQRIAAYDVYAFGGNPCPNNNHREPTGITYLNGYFYITDDNDGIVMQHAGDFGTPLLHLIDQKG
jgi:hypothetical protein